MKTGAVKIDKKILAGIAAVLFIACGAWWLFGSEHNSGGIEQARQQLEYNRVRVEQIRNEQSDAIDGISRSTARLERVGKRIERGETIANDSAERIENARAAIKDSRAIIKKVRARNESGK